MRTTDNNGGKSIDKFDNSNIADLSAIANRNLLDLQMENPDLLVFPHSFGQYKDDVEKPLIFSLDNENLTTYNLMLAASQRVLISFFFECAMLC